MMAKKSFAAFAAIFIVFPSGLFGAEQNDTTPATLRQCYEWAQAQSEDLKIRQEDINQSKARAHSSLGGAGPSIDWKYTHTRQDPKGVEALEAQGFSGFVQKRQTESKFTATQPLFSGFREFSAYSGFKRESARDTFLLERASYELLERTADAFYTVIAHESDQNNTKATYDLAEDRVKDLRGFLRLGKARESEVFTAQAHAAVLKARLDQIQAELSSAREELSFLTGQDLSTQPLQDEIPSPPPLATLSQALAQTRNRSDLKAQREDAAGKKLKVRYERGFRWPTADITGTRYTQRATFMEEIDWDVVFTLSMPLWRSGSISAKVKEALAAYRQSLLTLQEMDRQATHQVRSLHSQLAAAIQETRSQEEAARAAQKSYDALLKEYRYGLVTNLDVLQALDLLQTQKNARDAARIKSKQLFLRLSVAMEKPL